MGTILNRFVIICLVPTPGIHESRSWQLRKSIIWNIISDKHNMDEFLRKALYVEDENGDVDFNTAPTSGQDYLKRVIIEARNCEPVVVASINPKKVKTQTIQYTNDSGCPPAPEGYSPTKEWQHYQVGCFSELRTRLVQHIARTKKNGRATKPPNLPSIDKEEEWSAFCYGTATDETNHTDDSKGMPPLVSIGIQHPMAGGKGIFQAAGPVAVRLTIKTRK